MSPTSIVIIEIINRRNFRATEHEIRECFLSAQSSNVLVSTYIAIKNVQKLNTNKEMLATCNTWDKNLRRFLNTFKILVFFVIFLLMWQNFQLPFVSERRRPRFPFLIVYVKQAVLCFLEICNWDLVNWFNPNRTIRNRKICRLFLNFQG